MTIFKVHLAVDTYISKTFYGCKLIAWLDHTETSRYFPVPSIIWQACYTDHESYDMKVSLSWSSEIDVVNFLF